MKFTSGRASPLVLHDPWLVYRRNKMSAMQTISVQVTPEAAKAFRKASASERKKMELLLSLRLLDVARSRKSLETVMREASRSAQERGLTPENLDDLLKK